jgi:hypothetical protein
MRRRSYGTRASVQATRFSGGAAPARSHRLTSAAEWSRNVAKARKSSGKSARKGGGAKKAAARRSTGRKTARKGTAKKSGVRKTAKKASKRTTKKAARTTARTAGRRSPARKAAGRKAPARKAAPARKTGGTRSLRARRAPGLPAEVAPATTEAMGPGNEAMEVEILPPDSER